MSAGADIAILVPVKELSHTKTRLSPLLSGEERRRLAWVLLERVLREVARAQRHCRRVVVSNYAPAIELAEASGFEVIREARQISESDSVDAASTLLERQGVRGVLRVPLDLPLFRGEALQPLLEEAAAGRQAVLAPSRDRRGTNALYRSPPTLFPSRFGPDSLTLHEAEARRCGADVRVVSVEALELDLDDAADVAELFRRGISCPAVDYLASIDVAARLARMAREPA
ncbi:MAG: 2-phospho-L-lactate guanylyltransferase [SAR324 cluster bacterium]|nr:2-phospho-L-lactate guanylyltransferase [SAR324 cluster bacterium]